MGFAEMDAAAKLAHEKLEEALGAMTEEQRKGADYIVFWLKTWYRTAGYKRLCKPLVNK